MDSNLRQELSRRREAIDLNFDRSLRPHCSTADFRDSPQDGSVKVPRTAFFTNANWHVLKDNEFPFVAQQLHSGNTALVYHSIAMFTIEIIHLKSPHLIS